MPVRPRRHGPLLLSLLLAACGGSGGGTGASVLLVSLDTTRADALGCYGNPRASTPHLDGLAAEGIRFARAYTVAPLTLPSHVAMHTGLYPPRSSVRSNGPHPLPAAAETLAEAAARAGLATGAFVSAAVLDPHFGLDQGFAAYDAELPRPQARPEEAERPARETVAQASAWLEAHAREPFFLWVHLFDPHAPYAPPRALLQGRLAGEPYLAEVAAADAALGTLLETLEHTGAAGHTTVIVVGDHGEGLGQHAETTHGSYCYDSTLRVPLLLRAPGGPRGVVEERLASVVDVFPTVLETLGLAVPPGGDGRSLLGPDDAARGLYFESYTGYLSFGWSPLAGWIQGTTKYLHSSEPELYDLARDPHEEHDLFDGAAAVEPFRAAIDRVVSAPALRAEAGTADAELLSQIRALGYADAARVEDELPHPLAPDDRPSPRRMAAEEERLQQAFQLVARKDCDQARPLLDALVAANPHNLFALDMKAHCLARAGDRDGAIAILQRVVGEKPLQPEFYQRLGKLLLEAGRAEDACAAFAGGLQRDASHLPSLEGLVQALEAAGRPDEAAQYRGRLPR